MKWVVLILGYGFFLTIVTLGQPPGDTLGVEPKERRLLPELPAEPDEFDRREVDSYYDWRNDLFFRVFKLESMEAKPNYMTARRTYKVTVNRYGYEVAMTYSYPLFYWLDLNGDGEFEPAKGEMWIDVEEDGINGNERPYDPMSPGPGPRGPVPVPPAPHSRDGAVGRQPL